MIDRDDDREHELPEELRALQRELESFRIEERASFGPELRAELKRAWAEGPEEEIRGSHRPVRALLAASLGGLLVSALLIPPARAGFVRAVESMVEQRETAEAPPLTEALPEVVMDRPEWILTGEEPAGPLPGSRPAAAREDDPGARAPNGPFAFPDIRDRERTQVLIERFYPDSLQARGVGGHVGLLAWVSARGEVGEARIARSSGLPALDEAAVRAAEEIRFQPARREGVPRGAWVEFTIEFRPPPPPPPADTVVRR